MRTKSRNNKIHYNVRLDAEPLRQMKIIATIDGKTTSQLIRDAVRGYVEKWHLKKKESVLKREKDFKEMNRELNGWSGLGGNKWIESEEIW